MRIRPSIRLTTLPSARPYADRFRLAAEAGFEGVELHAGEDPPDRIREAAERHGIVVHSVHLAANWSQPLSGKEPRALAEGISRTLAALAEAKALGAGTLQLIPGRVTQDVSYREAYDRSQEVIRREILPAATELGIVLGIENVWNGFLLGPVEYAGYCDSFESPWVRPYLDVGNVIFGRPEDWIDICGARIVALHLKDFHLEEHGGLRLNFAHRKIGEGVVDWASVRAALERTGFDGWGTFAQAEHIQGPFARRLYAGPGWIERRVPGTRPAMGAAQAWLARRLLGDVMERYRCHLV